VNEASDSPRVAKGLAWGALSALVFAILYGLSAELIGLTFGLPVVALVAGWVIGTAVAYGAWGKSVHEPSQTLRRGAASLAVVGWVLGLTAAYVVSQALIPQAATALGNRLSVGGFLDYIVGLDIVRFIHLVSLAFVAFMAWRAAR
jgi:hypothetical protein